MSDEESTARPSAQTPEVPTPRAADEHELSDEDLGKVSGGTSNTFTSASNILKTRHDTAKNSISNVR